MTQKRKKEQEQEERRGDGAACDSTGILNLTSDSESNEEGEEEQQGGRWPEPVLEPLLPALLVLPSYGCLRVLSLVDAGITPRYVQVVQVTLLSMQH
jgi:hypothetical protein